MNTEFAWDRNSLSQADTVSDIPCLSDKDMVRKSVSKIKKEKAAGPSGAVSEIVKAAGETEADMITDLINQIIVEGVISVEWELCTIVN